MHMKLTRRTGGAIYVNMEHVISYVEIDGTTYLKPVKGKEIQVREPAAHIHKEVSSGQIRGTQDENL